MRTKLFSLILLFQILFSSSAFAQSDAVYDPAVLTTPGFFIVVISGVLLAFGFQFLLTALSVATGVSAVGDLKQSYVESKYNNTSDNNGDNQPYEVDPGTPTLVKITSALGVWNVITVSISLFLATYLALKLVPVGADVPHFTLALTIWATFFMLMFYLEGRLIGTLLGNMISTTIAGLRASGNAIKELFSSSPESKIQDIADSTIEKLRQEFSVEFDTDRVVNALNRFADKVESKVPDYNTLKSDLEQIVAKSGSNGSSGNSAAKWTAIQSALQTAIESDKSPNTEKAKRKKEELRLLLKDIKNAYQRGNTTSESLQNALAASPVDERKVNEYIDKIKARMRNVNADDFNNNSLQTDINSLLNDVKGSATLLQRELQSIDRDTIVETLSQNTALEKSKLNDYADKVEKTLTTVSEKLGVTNNDPTTESLLTQFERKVRQFIDGTDAPELNYALLKNDIKHAINNPKESLPTLKRRLSTFDRNTMIAILTNTPWIDQRHINKIADTVESAKNEVSQQLTRVETKARSTIENLKRRAVIEAEHTRQTAAAAAWWLVTSIIVSGFAAVLGGIVNF